MQLMACQTFIISERSKGERMKTLMEMLGYQPIDRASLADVVTELKRLRVFGGREGLGHIVGKRPISL